MNENGVQKQSFWNKKLRFLTPTKLFSQETNPAGGTATMNEKGVQKQSFWNKKLRFLTPTKLFSQETNPAGGTATMNENGARGELQPHPFVDS
jgi:hypothetical protein